MEEIILGTVGTSHITHVILDAAVQTPGITPKAVYSRNKIRALLLARDYRLPRVYTHYDALLRDPDVNCIYIASPNALHYPQTIAALEAGKHVICEKPFCVTGAQARHAAALAKEKGLFLVDAVPTTYLPNFMVLLEHISRIGEVKHVRCDYIKYSDRVELLGKGRTPNVFSLSMAGGALMDLGVYCVYLMIVLFGEPCDVRYKANRRSRTADPSDTRRPRTADISGSAVLDYGAFQCDITCAKDIQGVSEVVIEGEEGEIYIPGGPNGLEAIHVTTSAGTQVYTHQNGEDRRLWEIREVTRLMLAGNDLAIQARLDLGVRTIETLERARRSARLLFPDDKSSPCVPPPPGI